MKNLVRKLSVAVLCALVVCLSGCNKVKQISVTSVGVESIAPVGFRGVNVYLAVGIDNPAFQIGLSEIEGSLKHSGKILGRLAMDPFVLQAKSAEIYHLKALVTIDKEASLSELLALMDEKVLNECLLDISVRVQLKSGVAKKIRLNDIPLKKLLESTGK